MSEFQIVGFLTHMLKCNNHDIISKRARHSNLASDDPTELKKIELYRLNFETMERTKNSMEIHNWNYWLQFCNI